MKVLIFHSPVARSAAFDLMRVVEEKGPERGMDLYGKAGVDRTSVRIGLTHAE
jgi:hypothetical protein